MGEFDTYDVVMKALEIVMEEIRSKETHTITLSSEENEKILKAIKNINIFQLIAKEQTVNFGDKYEFSNIQQSIIAAGESIASGTIEIRMAGQDELANALEELKQAILKAIQSEISDEEKQSTLHLLDAFTKQASQPKRIKSVLKTLGNGLWESIKNVESIFKVATMVWPVIERLWT